MGFWLTNRVLSGTDVSRTRSKNSPLYPRRHEMLQLQDLNPGSRFHTLRATCGSDLCHVASCLGNAT